MSPTYSRRLRPFRFRLCSAISSGLVAAILLAGCGGKPDPDDGGFIELPRQVGSTETTGPTGIQPGERLDVYVMEDDSFSGSYQVGASGHIIVPKVGRILVKGMSAPVAEKAMKRELERDQLTVATVYLDRPSSLLPAEMIASSNGVDVLLSGKVIRPGRYTITPIGDNLPTVHQAILQAGGFSRFAYKSKVQVLRKGSDGRLHSIDADLLAIESGKAPDIPLASGDIIKVPEKAIDLGFQKD